MKMSGSITVAGAVTCIQFYQQLQDSHKKCTELMFVYILFWNNLCCLQFLNKRMHI